MPSPSRYRNIIATINAMLMPGPFHHEYADFPLPHTTNPAEIRTFIGASGGSGGANRLKGKPS